VCVSVKLFVLKFEDVVFDTQQDGRNFPCILLIFTKDWWPYASLFYLFVLQLRHTVL
jgi:hypothetical protein